MRLCARTASDYSKAFALIRDAAMRPEATRIFSGAEPQRPAAKFELCRWGEKQASRSHEDCNRRDHAQCEEKGGRFFQVRELGMTATTYPRQNSSFSRSSTSSLCLADAAGLRKIYVLPVLNALY